MKRWRIGLVVPRYGEDILGGAETLARGLAEQLVGVETAYIEVITTCARDHLTWQNELPSGETVVNGVKIKRFPIAHQCRNAARYDALHLRLIQGEIISPNEQYEWVDHSAHSPELYAYIERWGETFDFLIFVPYLFGITYYGAAIFPDRSILWPCLHDEVYAYLDPTRALYNASLGVMFNTYPEAQLAHRLYGPHRGGQVVGFGLPTLEGDRHRFQEQSGVHAPSILYSGRIESAKNVPLLVQNFMEYKRRRKNSLKLVLMGRGPEPIPKHPDIISLGFKQGQAKMDVYAGATLLCQPSVNESFSIVMMESWLCGVPVLVHADCAVARNHVIRSNGGLYFRDYDEFEAVLDLMLADESLRRRLGENGLRYVRTEYNWPAVLQRFESALESWDALRGCSD